MISPYTIRFASALMLGAACTFAAAATVVALQGSRRIVLYAAPNAADSNLVAQEKWLTQWQGAADRDVTGVLVAGDQVRGADDAAPDLRRRFDLPHDRFAVVLIGKDGHVALRSEAPLTGAALQAAIDAMPMRRAGQR